MRALIEYTIKSRIRDVTNLTVNIEAVALADKITPIHVHTDNLAKPQRVHVCSLIFILALINVNSGEE